MASAERAWKIVKIIATCVLTDPAPQPSKGRQVPQCTVAAEAHNFGKANIKRTAADGLMGVI